jgi:hypothetical protein
VICHPGAGPADGGAGDRAIPRAIAGADDGAVDDRGAAGETA